MTITDDKFILFVKDSESEELGKITATFSTKEEIAEKGIGILGYTHIDDVTIYDDHSLIEDKKEFLESLEFTIGENGVIDFPRIDFQEQQVAEPTAEQTQNQTN